MARDFNSFNLLENCRSAGFLELGDRSFRVCLRHGFLEHAEGFDRLLRFGKTETRELADDLDDADLVRAEILEDDVELRLLFLGGSSFRSACSACNGDGSGSGNAELLFQLLDELVELDNGHRLHFFNKLLNIHCFCLLPEKFKIFVLRSRS